MKRAGLVVVVVLTVAAFVVAQQQPSNSGSSTKQAGAAAQAQPQGKRLPQAKTQAEFDAYKATIANQNDPAAMEKAADDFAAKFPTSELRTVLYRGAMRGYQNANNGDKLSEVAQKLLKIDGDDPEALVNVAEVIAEHTRDTDLDKDQHFDEAMKNAQRALETIETDVPPGMTESQMEAYKGLLRSTAYSIMGTVAFNKEKYSDAEGYYRKSIDAYPSQPDPVVILRLTVALDRQEKYPEALKQANRAVELTQDGTAAGTAARHERDRLVQLTGGSAPAPPASTPTPQPK